MNNNIEFKIISNDEGTKFKIAYIAYKVTCNDESIIGTLSREFGSIDAAQEYLDKNREILIEKISETLPKEKVEEENIEKDNKEDTKKEVTIEDDNKEELETEENSTEEIVAETTEEVVEDEVSQEEQIDETEEELSDENIIDVEDYEPISEEGMVPRNTKKRHLTTKIIAAILALALVFGLGKCAGENNTLDGNDDGLGQEDPDKETEEPVLTTEVFNELTDKFDKILKDKNVNVTKEDVTKFVAIVNMDRLVVDNPELAKELFASLTREEYIQDAANVIARIYQHNSKAFEADENTQNFVRVSDALIGEQKQQLLVIESYADEIAKVSHDREQANNIIADLIVKMSAIKILNGPNHGVTFATQVSIETIRSSMARNILYVEMEEATYEEYIKEGNQYIQDCISICVVKNGTLTPETKELNTGIINNIVSLLKITRLDYKPFFEMYDNAKGIETKTRTLK